MSEGRYGDTWRRRTKIGDQSHSGRMEREGERESVSKKQRTDILDASCTSYQSSEYLFVVSACAIMTRALPSNSMPTTSTHNQHTRVSGIMFGVRDPVGELARNDTCEHCVKDYAVGCELGTLYDVWWSVVCTSVPCLGVEVVRDSWKENWKD